MTTYDAVVIGGGVVGASTAYHLVRAGVRTLLVDRRDVGRATDAGAGILSTATHVDDPDPIERFEARATAYYPILIDHLQGTYRRSGYRVRIADRRDRRGRGRASASDHDWRAPLARGQGLRLRRGRAGRGQGAVSAARARSTARSTAGAGRASTGGCWRRAPARCCAARSRGPSCGGRGADRRERRRRRRPRRGRADRLRARRDRGRRWSKSSASGSASRSRWNRSAARSSTSGCPGSIPAPGRSCWPFAATTWCPGTTAGWWSARRARPGPAFPRTTTAAGMIEVLAEALRVAPGLAGAEIREIRVGLRPGEPGRPADPRPRAGDPQSAAGHGPRSDRPAARAVQRRGRGYDRRGAARPTSARSASRASRVLLEGETVFSRRESVGLSEIAARVTHHRAAR